MKVVTYPRSSLRLCAVLTLALVLLPLTAAAELPPWLRTENGNVQDGNELLKKGDAKGALAEYDHAARSLPDNPGVQLDRGLSLLKMGELAKAREALLSATTPSASSDVRADAYQNLALAYYREADGLAQQNKHDEAQKLFREAVDAGKRSLRMRPSRPDVAWNLELAARRVREEEAKQKAEDDKKKQDQQNKQDKKDGQDQQGNPGDNKDQDKDQKQDSKQDPKDKPQGDQAKNEPQKQDGQDGKKPEPQPDKPKPEKPDGQGEKKPEPQPSDAQAKQGKEAEAGEKPIPKDVERALDALKDGEQNFERVRARNRAASERREPEKDW